MNKANKHVNDKNELILKIKNFHLDTVYLIGYSEYKNNTLVKFRDSILITPFQTKEDASEIKINEDTNFIFSNLKTQKN